MSDRFFALSIAGGRGERLRPLTDNRPKPMVEINGKPIIGYQVDWMRAQGVTDVVRGDDLLESAARQTLLYNALGHDAPHWWHLPLVLGPDGHRLAKRHGDTKLSTYRNGGTTPEQVLGLLACWCGCIESPRELTMDDFMNVFDPERLPSTPTTFTDDVLPTIVTE